ncbi:unnamed protein product, partial [Timema podura]|nr:unnamed protein product [Timema podura]
MELKCKTLMKKVKSELPSQPNYTCLKGENLLVITSDHRQYINDAFATIHDYGILIVDAVHKAFSPSSCILSNHLNVIADKFISVFNEFKTSESGYRIKWKKDNFIDQSKQTIMITQLLDKTVETIASSSEEVVSSTGESLQRVQGSLKGTMGPVVSHLNMLIESTTMLHHHNPDKARASCQSQYLNLLLNLEHYVSSCQFDVMLQIGYFKVLSRLMSVLLVIFIDFITKGFRIPPELADEEGKEGKATGGMGFGDGEGETDMSKDIVSQDQLEEALPNTDEPQEKEEKPCE